MRVVLFIGHHKVGSSAMQRHLAANAVALLRQGVLYPAVESEGQSRLLAMAMGAGGGGPLPVNLREAHNALAFAMIAERTGTPVPALHRGLPPSADMLVAIRRQVEILAPRTVVLAAEVFANFAAIDTGLIARLRETFPGARFEIAATLRRVDDYLASWHGQRLRFGEKVRPLAEALDAYYSTIHFDYRRMLEGWIATLPQARLHLRSYDRVAAAGGSVQDFMALLGLPVPPAEAGGRVNESLHRGLLEIARRANLRLEPAVAHEVFLTLLRLGPDLGLPPAADVELYGAARRREMAARFAPVQRWLSDLQDAAFFADAGAIADPRPVPLAEATAAALAALAPRLDAFPEPARGLLRGGWLSQLSA